MAAVCVTCVEPLLLVCSCFKLLVLWLLTSVKKTHLDMGIRATVFSAFGGAFVGVHVCILVGFIIGNLGGCGNGAGIPDEVGFALNIRDIFTRPLHDRIVGGVSNDGFQVEIVSSPSRDGYSLAFASR
jgi:hypothetical protein